MKKRTARKITNAIASYANWDTDYQPYTIPQQRKAFKVMGWTKYNFKVYKPERLNHIWNV